MIIFVAIITICCHYSLVSDVTSIYCDNIKGGWVRWVDGFNYLLLLDTTFHIILKKNIIQIKSNPSPTVHGLSSLLHHQPFL